ncbi:MAG: hypothetical protein ACD_5C00253G0006 [uncultured bacterium]|nr:MAG: hypothetical protein ACD_5C00253G0006 [uncultured bacterium]
MKFTDEELIEEYIKGDQKSLDFLIDKYLNHLYNFVFQLVRDQAASEDIVQETFFKAWKNINKFDKNKKFSTWLFAIAKNNSIDWLKKKREIPFNSFENEEGESYLENVEDENVLYSERLLSKIDSANTAKELLENVSPELRAILLLHHKNGFSLAEIAKIMGKSNNTLKSKYLRAIRDLRQKFFNKNAQIKAKSGICN